MAASISEPFSMNSTTGAPAYPSAINPDPARRARENSCP